MRRPRELPRLRYRLLWFCLLWLGGVGAVALLSLVLRAWLAPGHAGPVAQDIDRKSWNAHRTGEGRCDEIDRAVAKLVNFNSRSRIAAVSVAA
jgi:hypothetical protein